MEHYSNFWTFEIASLPNVPGHGKCVQRKSIKKKYSRTRTRNYLRIGKLHGSVCHTYLKLEAQLSTIKKLDTLIYDIVQTITLISSTKTRR